MKNKVGGLTLLNFKIYYKASEVKPPWDQYKKKYVDQQNRIKSPEMNLHMDGPLLLTTSQCCTMGKEQSCYSVGWAEGTAVCARVACTPPSHHTETNSTWVTDPNAEIKGGKSLKRQHRNKYLRLWVKYYFFTHNSKTDVTKKMNFIKTTPFCSANYTIKKKKLPEQ